MKIHRPITLIILDGWGHREEKTHNPIASVNTPTFDDFATHYPHSLLEASGAAVGLPDGQMGNSEVGHLHLGAGRKVPQDLTRINHAIENGSFTENAVLLKAINTAKKKQKSVHILGLVSTGGVHSLVEHIAAMIKLTHQQGVTNNFCHAILDGRDTPPKSAQAALQQLESLYQKIGSGQIASLIGRYYAMDRDQRWERTELAYNLLTQGKANYKATSATDGLHHAYQQGQTDEFVKPICIPNAQGKAITLEDGDVVIFMNFRADRARQLSYALTDPDFTGFERQVFPRIDDYITLTQYDKRLKAQVAYPPLVLNNTLGEYVARLGLKQLRIAETEKYAHVTYFINGGSEKTLPGEDRILIPSPKVATYDLQPEMSAIELTDKLTQAIESGKYDLIICNYANPDMVGHTGIEAAAIEAISVIDQCMQRILQALKKTGGEALITADHGNIECMYDEKHQQPHTAHTDNLVPIYYIGREATFQTAKGALDDVAPTLLFLLGLKVPPEMTGHNLLRLKDEL